MCRYMAADGGHDLRMCAEEVTCCRWGALHSLLCEPGQREEGVGKTFEGWKRCKLGSSGNPGHGLRCVEGQLRKDSSPTQEDECEGFPFAETLCDGKMPTRFWSCVSDQQGCAK